MCAVLKMTTKNHLQLALYVLSWQEKRIINTPLFQKI